jgi:hypothetical protein
MKNSIRLAVFTGIVLVSAHALADDSSSGAMSAQHCAVSD